jgi:hypothetical protein
MASTPSRRRMQRFPVSCTVQYATTSGAGEGRAVNVSLEGLRVRGNYAVEADTLLAITLYLGDQKDPVRILGASVQWARGDQFGVRLPPLPAPLQQRLITSLCIPPGQEHLLFEDPTTAEFTPELKQIRAARRKSADRAIRWVG